ncbi:hypothetical protein EC991_006791 [Linnemannia zychae]|nr:hypothetical protein EC991_006791 [Linnemannia zychae]
MPLCEHAIPEDNGGEISLAIRNLGEDINNDKSAIDPRSGTDHQRHHHVQPYVLPENNNASTLDQDVSDTIDQLCLSGDNCHDKGHENVFGGSSEHGSDGTATIRAHQQHQSLPCRLSSIREEDPIETASSPAALGTSPRRGDEGTVICTPTDILAFPCSSLSTIPSSATPTLQSPLLPNAALDPDNDESELSSPASRAGDSSLSSLSKPYLQMTTPRRAVNVPSGLPLALSPGMLSSEGGPSKVNVALVSQPYSRGNQEDVSFAADRTSFPTPDWGHQGQQGPDTTMAPWSPTLAETGFPSLIPSWDEISSSTIPFDTHPDHKSAYSNAAIVSSSLSYPEDSTRVTAALPSFMSSWPSEAGSGYAQSALYPSSPVRLDPAALAEYTRYPTTNRSVLSLHDALPPSSAPGIFLPYPHQAYYNGTGYHPTSYAPSTVGIYSPSRSGTSSGCSFSVSTPVGAGSYSHNFSVPTLPSYERMSSSLVVPGSDPYASSAISSNPLCVSSMTSLPSSNTNGSSLAATYSGFHHYTRDPNGLLFHRQQHHGSSTSTAEAFPNSFVNHHSQASIDPDPKKCSNCKTTATPSWRRCPQGRTLLCNACGLYQKLHGKARPFFKARDGTVRMRRNIPEHEPCTICEITQSAVWKKDINDAWICSGCYMLTTLDHTSPIQETAALVSVSGGASSSRVVTSSSKPFSFSPSPPASSHPHGRNFTSTNAAKRSTLVKPVIVPTRSDSPLHQERATRSARQSLPIRSEQSFKIKLRSSGRRTPYSQVQHPLNHFATSGKGAATHKVHGEIAATPVSTKGKAKKKTPSKSSSHGISASNGDASIPTSSTSIDYTISKSGQNFGSLATRDGEQGGFDAGFDIYDYGTIKGSARNAEGRRVTEYINSDWRNNARSSSSSTFYPDDPEPFLPIPEGSRSGNSSARGGGSIELHRQQYQQQSEQSSYQKQNIRLSRSYTPQPYYGYYQRQYQLPQQQHHHTQHEHQEHQDHYDRQQLLHQYHPTPSSGFPYYPPDTSNSYQSESLTLAASGSSIPDVAPTTISPGASTSTTVTSHSPIQLPVQPSSSAIPYDLTNGPVMVTISRYQSGSTSPMISITHVRDEGDHGVQDFKEVKLEREKGDMTDEGKEATMTTTGTYLSSAEELDSDE